MSEPCILWFRHDLRLEDNPALNAAIESQRSIIPVFILDDEGEGDWPLGSASKWWLHHALHDLGLQLQNSGLKLILRSGKSKSILEDLISDSGADSVYWNRRYEPNLIARDTDIKSSLSSNDIACQSFNASLLQEPHTIKNGSGLPFRVFTPYWKKCLSIPKIKPKSKRITNPQVPTRWPRSLDLNDLNLLPKIPWDSQFKDEWDPTTSGAKRALNSLVRAKYENYDTDRDRPDRNGTSRLSPYLRFGQISPRQIWKAIEKSGTINHYGSQRFLSEIGWREFSYYLLYHFPDTATTPLRSEFEDFPWKRDPKLLEAWQRGQTGYPIVDAGMRQLWRTGWMHNRVRMITASFLVKHLLQPWQEGAAWFWDTLVDADLASNTQGWQWVAGCGADASPYFRIFNPITQARKFDPAGEYIRKWVPELDNLETKFIHAPWEAPGPRLEKAGVKLGRDYPEPIISHFPARNRALEAYDRIKGHKNTP